jgi:hypothetical protein
VPPGIVYIYAVTECLVIITQHYFPDMLNEIFNNGNSYDGDYRIVLALLFTSIFNNATFMTTVVMYTLIFIPTAYLVVLNES